MHVLVCQRNAICVCFCVDIRAIVAIRYSSSANVLNNFGHRNMTAGNMRCEHNLTTSRLHVENLVVLENIDVSMCVVEGSFFLFGKMKWYHV